MANTPIYLEQELVELLAEVPTGSRKYSLKARVVFLIRNYKAWVKRIEDLEEENGNLNESMERLTGLLKKRHYIERELAKLAAPPKTKGL